MSSQPLVDIVQTIIDGINEKLSLQLTKDDVLLGQPTHSVDHDRDTHLRVEIPELDMVINTYYYRLDLTILMDPVSKTFSDDGELNTLELLPKLAAARLIPFYEEDFISSEIERIGETTQLTLRAHPDSLRLRGQVGIELVAQPVIPPNAILTEEGLPILTEEGNFLLIVE